MTSRTRIALLVSAAAVGAVALALASPGCSKPAEVPIEATHAAATDPWGRVAAQLRKENTPAAARRILGQLNTDLATAESKYQPAGLPPDAEKAARDLLALSEDELKEVRPSTYTALDPQYLADCLAMRDTARSLEVGGLPPARQAELAFAWVCRQVVLSPWAVQFGDGRGGVAARSLVLPVGYVLRRGSGSGLERAYVFLALAQQLGLDACLVGPPDAATKPASPSYRPGPEAEVPKGPFWAVGVRAGAEVYLFDPWKGEPVAGPSGTATLNQVRANPDLVKGAGVSAEAAKAAVPVLTVPLLAVAPRMRRLEQELGAESGVRLAVDPATLKARFAAEGKVPDVRFWAPSDGDWLDRATPTRVLRTILPAEEGGAAPSPDREGRDPSLPPPDLTTQYRINLLPRTLFDLPAELRERPDDPGVPEALERLIGMTAGVYAASFLDVPSPREQVQRGQFKEANLVEKQKGFAAARERIRTDRNREEQIRKWAEEARKVYTALSRARGRERTEPGATAQAQQDVDQFWKNTQPVVGAIVDLAVAEAGQAEATYLIALAMHEQAERSQARFDRAAADPRQASAAGKARTEAAEAWAEAKGWWGQYDRFAAAQDRTSPGRAAHARQLTDRAARQAADLKSR